MLGFVGSLSSGKFGPGKLRYLSLGLESWVENDIH